jgi:TrpR-related protein YerC/YecD
MMERLMATPILQPTRDVDRLTDELCDALLTPQTREEMRRLLRDLCTPAELRALAERWHVARLLDGSELSYREIHDGTGVSTTTIVRVGRFLRQEPHQGYRRAIDALEGADVG